MYSGMAGSYRSDRRESVSVGVRRRVGAIGAARLPQDAAYVIRGGVLTDRERRTDLAVAESLGDESEDRPRARRQTVREAGSRNRRAERLDPAEERGHADAPGERRGFAEE